MSDAPAHSASPAASGGGDLRTRIVAALVLAPLVLLAAWAGGAWFGLLLFAGVLLMAREWVDIVHGGDAGQFALHAIAGASGLLAAALPGRAWLFLALAGLSWLASLWLTARARRGFTIHHVSGPLYIALAALALTALRASPTCGAYAIFYLFAVVWSADSLAYFAGRALGGPKFAPRISPKKTWSGFFGAMAGGALAGLAFAWVTGLPAGPLFLVGALLGGFEQFGDLYESAMKRRFGVKDSGALIPGHGGILDRVDGLVAAALAFVIGALATGTLRDAGCGLFKLWGWP
jgi:phosphatidate cytidylyltransferase